MNGLNLWVFPKIVGNPPKWMVNIKEHPIKMDALGGKTPYFWKHPYGRWLGKYTVRPMGGLYGGYGYRSIQGFVSRES